MPAKKNKLPIPFFERINSVQRLLICLIVAVAVYFLTGMLKDYWLAHIMIAWDSFSICMIVMSWASFFIVDSKQIRQQSRVQDPRRSLIFIVVLISTLASILAVVLLVISKMEGSQAALRLITAVAGMLLSWILIHTIFTLRYAHIFYGDHKTKPDTHAGGLDFPGGENPEYLDFAYFAFVIGMTFQVSDVEITSKRLRKLALFHSMLSFGFNTIMIALTINLIAGFGN